MNFLPDLVSATNSSLALQAALWASLLLCAAFLAVVVRRNVHDLVVWRSLAVFRSVFAAYGYSVHVVSGDQIDRPHARARYYVAFGSEGDAAAQVPGCIGVHSSLLLRACNDTRNVPLALSKLVALSLRPMPQNAPKTRSFSQ